MDRDVLAALARWPDVPAAYGWLSLDARGRWRLHPQGDAALGGPGDAISNPAILAFIARNYGHDETGRWFFQNGPQRVYVRLDAAPLIMRLADAQGALTTHTGAAITRVTRWAVDPQERLHAMTEHGPGAVEDRDLPALLDVMRLPDGRPLLDAEAGWFEAANPQPLAVVYPPLSNQAVTLTRLEQPAAHALGFIANPRPVQP